ncbi:hypothetical protein AB0B89_35560 [Sphaerisporangium sp. NPDC049002]|uniref:hypothetical protein n=1 Tax=unclassified Sphaerisporangium TaxID=2630420 RepID=UPI0033DF48DF
MRYFPHAVTAYTYSFIGNGTSRSDDAVTAQQVAQHLGLPMRLVGADTDTIFQSLSRALTHGQDWRDSTSMPPSSTTCSPAPSPQTTPPAPSPRTHRRPDERTPRRLQPCPLRRSHLLPTAPAPPEQVAHQPDPRSPNRRPGSRRLQGPRSRRRPAIRMGLHPAARTPRPDS